MRITDSTRTEEITEREAQCLRAGFLANEDKHGNLTPPPGQPVGRGTPVSYWELIDRLLTRLRSE